MILLTNMWRASPHCRAIIQHQLGVLHSSSTLTLATWMLHQIPYIKGSVLQVCTLFPFQIQLTNPGGPLSFWPTGYRLRFQPLFPRVWVICLEKTLQSPLDFKEIQPVHPKGSQSWIFIGRTDAETLIFWPPDAKNCLIGKDPDAGKDWGQEKGPTEDETVGWHHWLDGQEFEQAPGVGDGQGSLVCCSQWGHKELDTTEWLNWTEKDKRSSKLTWKFQIGGGMCQRMA